eukprot:GFUD01092280.1.p1 GENE.GFUD01092280.1~~GFUD01092280.1.p1  ORF type:complete len:434 (-),score=99.24 GFUD01092280.1:22-1323(-)
MGDPDPIPKYHHVVPTTQVKTGDGVAVWEDSEAYQEYLGFIIAIGESVKGRKITEEITMSCCCRRLVELLTILRKNIGETPPCEMQSRYGNPAYRDWFTKLESSAETLVGDLLCTVGDEWGDAVVELVPYLVNSFGNKTRIDYGTGHEMTFVMFLCGIFKIGALKEADRTAVGMKVFGAYMTLCRDLQSTYRMEPAGSMGVWNLDDYQFVSFIWGAAQLCEKARIKPKSISDPEMAEMLCKENHFFACLAYIHKAKTGPFHEHSNQLWNISGVPMWSKVFTGLIKMYRAEVLCKFPVIQHTLFGSIFTLQKAIVKNPSIPTADVAMERPGVPGVDSPRPGIGMGSRFPRPGIPGIDLPPPVPGITMQDIRIPPTACPMPGARVPGLVMVGQFPGPGNPTQFPGPCPNTRLPAPDFQSPKPTVSLIGPTESSNP